jgi:hypothetical protein
VKRLLFAAFFIEVGLVLIIVPWSAFWEDNYFAQMYPFVFTFITNNFVRGAISGLGVLNVILGLGELVALIVSRNVEQPTVFTTRRDAEQSSD